MTYPRIIYILKHNPTGRVYVGSSADPSSRIATHISYLRNGTHSNAGMQADFDKYGDDYSVCLADVICGHRDRDKEFLWMDVLNARDPEYGYNDKDHSKPASSLASEFWQIPLGALGDFKRELIAWERMLKEKNNLDPVKRRLLNTYPSARMKTDI